MIRVLIVAGVRLYRDGLTQVLKRRPTVSVVGSAADAASAVREATKLRPDVLLLDMALPSAGSTVQALAGRMPAVRIVGLGIIESEEEIVRCIQAGASAYVTREGTLQDLVVAVESVNRGEMRCSPTIAAALARRVASLAMNELSGADRLSYREREVADLVEVGLSNKQIADRLHIQCGTVKHHIHSLLEKLGARTRGEAAARLRRTPFSRPSHALGPAV